jgi:hypothetical protein
MTQARYQIHVPGQFDPQWKADTIRRLQTVYQASGYFECNAHSTSADGSEVDDQFATEPLTAVKPAEQRVSEEELLRAGDL